MRGTAAADMDRGLWCSVTAPNVEGRGVVVGALGVVAGDPVE
ncbi:hypothetical protein [Streptomyces sp. WAC 04229]|nr:hypothetical protein [Streptomyces sp. WAC 04229]